MARKLTYIPNRVIDTNGISDGASIHVYATGTTTPVSIYSDESLTTPLANPYVVPAGAAVPEIYHNESGSIRVRIVESGGAVVSDDDPYMAPITDIDLASTDAGKGAALVAGAGKTIATRAAMKALTGAGNLARPILLTEGGRRGWFNFNSADLSTEVTADTEEGVYVAPDSDPTGVSGAWVRAYDGPVFAHWFGGRTNEAAQACFNAVSSGASAVNRRVVAFDGAWTMNGTVTIPDPHNLTVDAHGARFTGTYAGVWFNLNGRADPLYTDNESRQHFFWRGGEFIGPGAATASTCFLARGFRHYGIFPESLEKFGVGVNFSGKDTLFLDDIKFFDCDIHILNEPWSHIGGPLITSMRRNHHSCNSSSEAVSLWEGPGELTLDGHSFNCGNGYAGKAFHLRRTAQVILTDVTGTFQVGETVTGGTSGITATVLYVTPWTHSGTGTYSSGVTLALGSPSSVTNFTSGETLTGGTSGATASVRASQNNPFVQAIRIGVGHVEAGGAGTASGAHGYLIEDLCGNGNQIIGVEFDAGSLGINGAGVTGAEFRRVNGLKIVAGRFAQSTGTPIRFDASCSNVSIDRSVTFSSGTIDLNGMSRDRLDLTGFNQMFQASARPITGLTALSLSAGATSKTTVDMSSAFPDFATVGGLPPKAYNLAAYLKASTASTGTNVRLRVYHPDEAIVDRMPQLQVGGFLDNQVYSLGPTVGADANGDIAYDGQNTGGGTATAGILVTGMHF